MKTKAARKARERELQAISNSNRDLLLQLFKQASGLPPGASPRAGTLASEMIAAILEKEYGADPHPDG